MFNYDESSIKKSRELFLTDGNYAKEEVRHEVLDSWERSKELLNFDLTHISVPSTSKLTVSRVAIHLRDHILPNIISCLYDSLDIYQGALFYAYDNGVVFSQRGNEEMLRYLNSLNLGIGTCITEQYLGTTAMSLINKPNQEAWAIGEEHYLDIFTSFATHCYCSNDFNETIYTFIILPKKAFTPLYLSYIRMFHKTWKATIEEYRNELELFMRNEFYDQLLKNENKAVLFLDYFGKILSANKLFTSWFNVKLEQIISVECTKIFPELKKAVSCMQTEKEIRFEEIFFPNAPVQKQYLRMDVTPMNRNGKFAGLLISFSDSQSVRKKVNKISNSQAYYTFDNILGTSNLIQSVEQMAMTAAHSNSSVIITGESGTGKELFAQSIHNESNRSEGPFVALNCATMQPELIASELFGYVEGAFTGARKGGSMGKFEYADQGTIFLDEIGELPMFAQTMLLRVLEERVITRVGSNSSTPIDVRLISATNRNLKKMIKEGTFRLDLYYRINVIHLDIPPLRERITDIPLLVNYYINYYNEFLEKKVKQISQEALSILVSYSWPGNLRELKNTLECSMNNVKGATLQSEDLPQDILDDLKDEDLEEYTSIGTSEHEFIKEERKKILCLMLKCNGNKSHVAEKLGISRSTLYKKLNDYQIN